MCVWSNTPTARCWLHRVLDDDGLTFCVVTSKAIILQCYTIENSLILFLLPSNTAFCDYDNVRVCVCVCLNDNLTFKHFDTPLS